MLRLPLELRRCSVPNFSFVEKEFRGNSFFMNFCKNEHKNSKIKMI